MYAGPIPFSVLPIFSIPCHFTRFIQCTVGGQDEMSAFTDVEVFYNRRPWLLRPRILCGISPGREQCHYQSG